MTLLFQVIISVISIFITAYLSNYFAGRRYIENKKREYITGMMKSHFLSLTDMVTKLLSRDGFSQDTINELLSILYDIQLLGKENQIEFTVNIMENLDKNRIEALDNLCYLIQSLRDEFRKEVGLSKIYKRIKYVKLQ